YIIRSHHITESVPLRIETSKPYSFEMLISHIMFDNNFKNGASFFGISVFNNGGGNELQILLNDLNQYKVVFRCDGTPYLKECWTEYKEETFESGILLKIVADNEITSFFVNEQCIGKVKFKIADYGLSLDRLGYIIGGEVEVMIEELGYEATPQ
ncbi:MAG: hypothetical protein ABIJ16_10880, partial [Bacteroidota bacterium]